jgi:hypothetical protein
MGEVCGAHREEEIQIEFLWGNLKDIDHLEHFCIDGRVIFSVC